MAFRQKFRIEGLKELDEVLKELPKATARNVLKRTLVKEAQPIVKAGEANAPRLTGKLAQSYVVGTKLSKRQASLHRSWAGTQAKMTDEGWRSATSKSVYVFVGPTPHPKSVQTEFGNAHQAAHPHMRPAWDGNVMNVLDGVTQTLRDEIAKAVARLAKKAARDAAKMKVS